MEIAVAIAGVVLSLIVAVVAASRISGRESEKLIQLGLSQRDLELDVKHIHSRLESHEHNDTHTSIQLRQAQEANLAERFRSQQLNLDAKFEQLMLRIEQLGKEMQKVEVKVDKALALYGSLSAELRTETGKLADQIQELADGARR